ncbi:hypothetical protein PVAND_015119 [Polypedilum vanderplanki]|uniref:F-box domain-containing protein n=1 Tax=Polypedilum vanderplanki TaxID=319348 RepID=A0A9J6BC34_POLVA|nr:hypothetical protein PVAND_015119 [Polypedilum vanderplanki]
MEVTTSITKIFTNEIFLEIFKNLSLFDLKNLTLTCKKFNQIISQSTELCSKYRVCIAGDMKQLDWLNNRKYTNFKLQYIFVQHNIFYVSRALRKYGPNVKNLVIQDSSITTEDLRDLLQLMPNVKKLQLCEIYLRTYREKIIKSSQLEYIECIGLPIYLNLFDECTKLNGLSLTGNDEITWPIAHYEEFLLRQKNLKRLKISKIETFSLIFSRQNLSENAKFRLTHFGIEEIKFSENNFENFLRFLKLHRETLEFVELSEIEIDETFEILKNLREFPKLKTLRIFQERKIVNFNSADFEPLENIQNLLIESKKVKNISKIFPNLSNLVIKKGKIHSKDLEKLKNLEKLTFINCQGIKKFQNPTVKNLTFILCSFYCFSIKDIEKLSIKSCKNVDWLLKFLQNSKNLKILEISNTKLDAKTLKKLEESQEKIDKIYMKNVEKINSTKKFLNQILSIFCIC